MPSRKKIDLTGLFSNFVLDSKYFIKNRDEQGHKIPSILFCLFDAGETLALQPVMEEMLHEEIPIQILAFGTAWSLLREKKECMDLNRELDWPIDQDARVWDRYQPVSDKFLSKIRALACPDIVITGMVSQFQYQICQMFNELSSEILAYYDAFSPLKKNSIQEIFIGIASQILVPSSTVAKSIQKVSHHALVHVVGQPSLEYWVEMNKKSYDDLRKTLHLDREKPVILFVGGYGNDYKAAFEIFVEAAPYLKDFQVIFSAHPKTDGSYEKKALNFENIKFIHDTKQITTAQLVNLADLILTINSTVGVQASFLGKPVIYIHTPDTHYTCVAIELNWAAKVTNSCSLRKEILACFNTTAPRNNRFLHGGIPEKSTKKILQRIAVTQNWLKRKNRIASKSDVK